MRTFDCEYTVEQYKILKRIYKKHSMLATECKNAFGDEQFQRSFKLLVEANLIKRIDKEISPNQFQTISYELTIEGVNTYFILHEERVNFWRKILHSKWIDVVVSFITAFITYFIMPHLCDWLSLTWE